MKTIRAQLARGYAQWEYHLTTMEGAEVLVVSSGIPFQLWRLYQHFWLVCLLFPTVSLVQTPLPPVRLFLALAALLFFAVSYTWLMWPHPASSGVHKRSRSPHRSSCSASWWPSYSRSACSMATPFSGS